MTLNSEHHYDVIVVGGGLGALAAAAWLAKAGKKVLVAEKAPRVGGHFGEVVHGANHFINGPVLLVGCNADGPNGPGPVHALLERLGVRQHCEFLPVQPFATFRMPGLEFRMWSGREAFVDGLNAASPGMFDKLPALLDLCGRIHRAGSSFYAATRMRDQAKAATQLMGLLPYQYLTMDAVLERYLRDARARAVVGAIWPFLCVPPRRASFLYWAALMGAYIDDGAHFCRGGWQPLGDAVARAFTRDGGVLLLDAAVTRILVQDQRARGVELADGRRFHASEVLANVDPRLALGDMLAPDQRPRRYLRALGRLEQSYLGLVLAFTTDLDLTGSGLGYETMVIDGWDAAKLDDDMGTGKTTTFGLSVLNAADPGMAPPGQHAVVATTALPASFDCSPANVRRATTGLMDAVERQLPGLKHRLLLGREGDVPDGYLTSVLGPIYGWALTPRHAVLRRLAPTTPVRGLTLVGQWTRPGPGASAVIMSGLDAAKRLLR